MKRRRAASLTLSGGSSGLGGGGALAIVTGGARRCDQRPGPIVRTAKRWNLAELRRRSSGGAFRRGIRPIRLVCFAERRFVKLDVEKLEIINYPDPRLRQAGKPVEEVTPQVRAVARRMLELMKEADGVGLAAPQVGLAWRMFVSNPT